MCSTAHTKCKESDSCKRLYENWEKKCTDLWESTTDGCSDECKNATVELYHDLYGQDLRGCDCGTHDYANGLTQLPEKVRCFERKIKLQEVCKINDANQCQGCRAKKG